MVLNFKLVKVVPVLFKLIYLHIQGHALSSLVSRTAKIVPKLQFPLYQALEDDGFNFQN